MEGYFVSIYNTSESIESSQIKWIRGEPNGRRIENCVEFSPNGMNDNSCDHDHRISAVCMAAEIPQFKLRGTKNENVFFVFKYLVTISTRSLLKKQI